MIRTLFGFSGTIDRRTYIAVAFCGVLVKHIIDLCLATFVFHRPWSPLNYLIPLGVPVSINNLSSADLVFLASMVAVSLPFAWVGVAITVKRFRAIEWPVWLSVLFFVPMANIASFVIAAIWPEHRLEDQQAYSGTLQRIVPRDPFGAAVLATVASAVLGVAFVAIGTRILTSYGWGLFAGIPFSEGALAAFLYGAHQRRTLGQSVAVALSAMLLTLAGLFAVALEGAICIAMAAPLALILAFVGALFGHVVQSSGPRLGVSTGALLVVALLSPGIMGAEAVIPREAPTFMVQSELVINATPMQVWKHVIAFPDLPSPSEPVFRVGVAYPERAKIMGRGAGATRYCEFSTGSFVEPVTVWQPGKLLAFRVTHNPEPMRELGAYPGLETPHLRGYMVSRRGEFDLQPLSGGRTLLIGRTWYQHHLWPAGYWRVYSDAIIHQIHMRVLRHIKRLAES